MQKYTQYALLLSNAVTVQTAYKILKNNESSETAWDDSDNVQ
jgi:hypothetical protein